MNRASPRSKYFRARPVRLHGMLGAACLAALSIGIFTMRVHAAMPEGTGEPSQAEISAAFIFNFAKFTEWPPEEFPNVTSPITVCFLGADQIRAAFQGITNGKDVNGHPVLVRDVKNGPEVLGCRVAYLDSPNNTLMAAALLNARIGSSLAVGASNDFLAQGGMIRLLVENNRMRFDVNVGAANRAKVRLSSKLLALARSVVELPDRAGN
jgi:hypothetical protein